MNWFSQNVKLVEVDGVISTIVSLFLEVSDYGVKIYVFSIGFAGHRYNSAAATAQLVIKLTLLANIDYKMQTLLSSTRQISTNYSNVLNTMNAL